MGRKTFNVEQFVDKVNSFLAEPESKFNNATSRHVLQNFATDVLMETNNYKGFQYLTKDSLVNKDNTPGIEYMRVGDDLKPVFYDDSRARLILVKV